MADKQGIPLIQMPGIGPILPYGMSKYGKYL